MRKIAALIIWMIWSCAAFAQRPMVSLWADTAARLIGTVAEVQMEATYPAGLPVLLAYKPDTTGNLEWLGQTITDSMRDGGSMTLRGMVKLMAFDSGSFTAGPIFLINTNTGDSFASNTISLRYQLAEVDTTQDIKPLSGLMDVPFTFREAVPYIIGAVILVLLGIIAYLFYRRWKNRPKTEKPAMEGPKIPLHERALARLQQLEQAGLWQQGREKEYQSELTEILREYIEERYLLPAMESTSTEILETFSRQVRDMLLYSLLERCLTIADYVKFARGTLTGREHEMAMQSAREFVIITTPEAERRPE